MNWEELKELPQEQRIEICVRALFEACGLLIPAILQLSETADRLETDGRALTNVVSKRDAQLWESALMEALKEDDRQ